MPSLAQLEFAADVHQARLRCSQQTYLDSFQRMLEADTPSEFAAADLERDHALARLLDLTGVNPERKRRHGPHRRHH